MAPRPHPWFRLYTETTRDLKVRRLRADHRWLWITILCMAGSSADRGRLLVAGTAATVADIADEAALPPARVKAGLAELEALGMIVRDADDVLTVPAWEKRQYESDRSTARVTAFRQRRSNVTSAVDVTAPESESEDRTNSRLSVVSREGRPHPVDDDERKLEEVIDFRARHRMQRSGGEIAAPDRYLAKIRTELEPERELMRRLVSEFPDAPVQAIVGHLEREPNTLASYRRPEAAG
jgi:hypothetical protein